MIDTVQLKLALGGGFISCIKDAVSAAQSGSCPDLTVFNKEVTIRTQGCRLKPEELSALRRAATIAISKAADSVAAQYGMSKGQVFSTLWPDTRYVTATLTFSPPNSFGWDLDLDEN